MMRSPSYPSTPLEEAIDLARKLHQVERKNPIDREVAAKALGYSGITGRSATILSNLIQYGLLEKTGKNEVRVADRAVEIMERLVNVVDVGVRTRGRGNWSLRERLLPRVRDHGARCGGRRGGYSEGLGEAVERRCGVRELVRR